MAKNIKRTLMKRQFNWRLLSWLVYQRNMWYNYTGIKSSIEIIELFWWFKNVLYSRMQRWWNCIFQSWCEHDWEFTTELSRNCLKTYESYDMIVWTLFTISTVFPKWPNSRLSEILNNQHMFWFEIFISLYIAFYWCFIIWDKLQFVSHRCSPVLPQFFARLYYRRTFSGQMDYKTDLCRIRLKSFNLSFVFREIINLWFY